MRNVERIIDKRLKSQECNYTENRKGNLGKFYWNISNLLSKQLIQMSCIMQKGCLLYISILATQIRMLSNSPDLDLWHFEA